MDSPITRTVRKLRSDGVVETASVVLNVLLRRPKSKLATWRMGDSVTLHNVEIDLTDVEMDEAMSFALYYGEYEQPERDAMQKYTSRGMDVIELGACVGYIPCITERVIGDEATHVAVEANPRTIPALERTRKRNGCGFSIVHAAYSPTGEAVKITPTQSAWGASEYRDGGGGVDVDAVTIESLIDEFDASEFALLCDIEGGEADLIHDELPILEQECAVLIVEFHDEREDIDATQRERIRDAKRVLESSSFDQVDVYGDVQIFKNTRIQ